MPSQFIFWPITLPEENPNLPEPDQSLASMHTPPPPPPRGRSRKSAKQAIPKRPPQRGLGVAQLERLRMEQAGETELLMHGQNPRRVVLPHMFVGPYAPQAGQGGVVLPGTYPSQAGPEGGMSALGQYPGGTMGNPGYMVRYLAPPAPEPPSTQMVSQPLMPPPVDPVTCYSDQCEFCVRKRRLFGETPVYENVNCSNHLDMDLAATVKSSTANLDGGFMASIDTKVSAVEGQIREYQFFPTYSGSLAEMVFPTMADASTTLQSPSPYPSQPIDLSLKL